MLTKIYTITGLAITLLALTASAQEMAYRQVALGGAKEVVAEINGGFGTLYIKRGGGEQLMTVRQKNTDGNVETSDINIEYRVEDGIGYLTMDMGTEGQDDMNALACLLNGNNSKTWYVTINDQVPVRFDLTLGAGKASVDLTGIHVREFNLDAGAGSVRLRADRPNREEIGRMSISTGVGALRADRIGNLRFNVLDFEGGLGEYVLDCTGDLPDNAKIISDVGVGSLTIVLPKGVGAKALTDGNWFSSRKMYGFVRMNDDTFQSRDYDNAQRKVHLDIQSGLGSVAVRLAK